MNYKYKLPINDQINLKSHHMEVRLKRFQSYKNQNRILIIFNNETAFSDFRKSKKEMDSDKRKILKTQKLAKKYISQCMEAI